MQKYLNLLKKVIDEGVIDNNRTGIPTQSIFGEQIRINLQQGFPLLTTKRVFFKGVVHELLWFLKGSTNVKELQKNHVHIWDEWAEPKSGELGPIYGHQWRKWKSYNGEDIDQIKSVIQTIKNEPNSRRMIVSAWNVAQLNDMKLMPCHCLFQFHVINDTLSCHTYQRSADIFLGVPFNIASYSLLTHMIAQTTELKVGDFIHSFGNLHLYQNHLQQALKQLERKPKKLPTLKLNKNIKNIDEFSYEDISIIDYKPHPTIKAPIAI